MAEALFSKLSNGHEAKSAGLDPGEKWLGKTIDNTMYVKVVMDEEGIDVRKKVSKKITEEAVNWADKVVVLGERENWPAYLKNSGKAEYWEIADPAHTGLETHRKTKDQIKENVLELIEKL